jgi:hypothetical protein
MLTIVIRTQEEKSIVKTAREVKYEPLQCSNFADWETRMFGSAGDGKRHVITEPGKSMVDFGLGQLLIETESGTYEELCFVNCDVFVMNENGKTVATYHV